MKKRLLGIFDSKKLTAEQIYNKVVSTMEKNEHMELLKMAKERGIIKKKKRD